MALALLAGMRSQSWSEKKPIEYLQLILSAAGEMRYWQGLWRFSKLSRFIRLGVRPQANWICPGLINSGGPTAGKRDTGWLLLCLNWSRGRGWNTPTLLSLPEMSSHRAWSHPLLQKWLASDFHQGVFNLAAPAVDAHRHCRAQRCSCCWGDCIFSPCVSADLLTWPFCGVLLVGTRKTCFLFTSKETSIHMPRAYPHR